jgi:flagellar basal-body rod protein FlgG
MLDGLYSAAAGMAAEQQKLDSLSNDIANINTDGYKSVRVGFHDLLYNQSASLDGGQILHGAGAGAGVIGFDESEGGVNTTGNPLDVAIQGDGFIEVHRADGSIGLTRDGHLGVNAHGQLTADGGDLIVPPVTLPKGTDASAVEIASDGSVRVSGHTVGKISLVSVAAPDKLLADGTGLLTPSAASGTPRAATGTTLQQGALESSNVNLAQDLVEMSSVQRSYSLASEAIQIQEQMSQTANGLRQ